MEFGKNSKIAQNWLRYLNTNSQNTILQIQDINQIIHLKYKSQEVEEDYNEQKEKAKQEYTRNKDLQKIISQAEIVLQKGYVGINSFNYSLYDVIYELRVDYSKIKELMINILTTFFFVNPKYNLSIEIMRVVFFFLLFSSESATYKFLKAYYSLLPSYLLENDKVVDILTQKVNSQFQNKTYCQNNEHFKSEFLVEKYHKHIISFLVNYLRFETQITLIDNIFISKSVNLLFINLIILIFSIVAQLFYFTGQIQIF